jgi:YVTN family beta-propeller protein
LIAAVPVDPGVSSVTVNSVSGLAYTGHRDLTQDPDFYSVSVIDTSDNSLVTTIPMIGFARSIDVNPVTNLVYAALDGNLLTVIDGATHTIVANIPIVSAAHEGTAVNPATNRIYVTNLFADSVSVIDGATDTQIAVVTGVDVPWDVAVNPATNRVYVPNANLGTISVIDGATNSITATIAAGGGLRGIAVNRLTNRIYAAQFTGFASPGNLFVIDGNTNLVVDVVSVGSGTVRVAVNETRNRVFVGNFGSDSVTVIDGSTHAVVANVALGPDPIDLAVHPILSRVYIPDQRSTVFVIQDDIPEPEGCSTPETIDYQGFTANDCAAPQNSITVLNQAELDAYLSDFGFDGTHVRDVVVKFDPTGDVDIVSPCEIRLAGGGGFLEVQAERVCLYGRRGVTVAEDHGNPDQGISATHILLVSEEGSAGLSNGLHLTADTIKVIAANQAKVGLACTVEAGSLELISTGDLPSSDALVRQGSQVTADSMTLRASRAAKLGPDVVAEIGGSAVLESTGSAVGSVASIEQSAVLRADSVSQTASNKVVVGKDVLIEATNAVEIDAAGVCSIAASAVIVGSPATGSCLD